MLPIAPPLPTQLHEDALIAEQKLETPSSQEEQDPLKLIRRSNVLKLFNSINHAPMNQNQVKDMLKKDKS